jgi:hypothetical protein
MDELLRKADRFARTCLALIFVAGLVMLVVSLRPETPDRPLTTTSGPPAFIDNSLAP